MILRAKNGQITVAISKYHCMTPRLELHTLPDNPKIQFNVTGQKSRTVQFMKVSD